MKDAKLSSEELLRREEIRRAKDDEPVVTDLFKKSIGKLITKPENLINSIRQNLSPKTMEMLIVFYEKANKKKPLSDAESKIGVKLVNILVRAMFGKDLLSDLGDSSDGVVIIFSKNFAKFLGAPDLKFESKSAEADIIATLVQDFIKWTRLLDTKEVGETLSRLLAIQEMKEEKWSPTTASLPDSAVLESKSNAMDDFSSRLTFRVANEQRSLNPDERTKYEVVHGQNVVGHIESDPNIDSNRHSQRCWVCTMHDLFDDAEFSTGFDEQAPFTTVRNRQLLLRNPSRLTMREAKSWIRTIVDRH